MDEVDVFSATSPMEVFSVPLCQSRRSTVSTWINTFGIIEAHYFHPNLIVLQETSSLTKTFQALIDEITREFIKGRAIPIVWVDEEKLNKFDVTFRTRHPIDHNQAGDPLKLTDEMDQACHQSVVIQANTYSLTIISRSRNWFQKVIWKGEE